MRYTRARLEAYYDSSMERHYMADCLRVLTHNTAAHVGDGLEVSKSLSDFKEEVFNYHPETRTQEEIVDNISVRLDALGRETTTT